MVVRMEIKIFVNDWLMRSDFLFTDLYQNLIFISQYLAMFQHEYQDYVKSKKDKV